MVVRKTFAFISLIAACLLLLTAWVLTSVQLDAFDTGFYTDQYTKLGLSSYSRLSQTDYTNAMKDLLDYTSGSKAQIDVQGTMDGATTQIFNDREKEHMVDVRMLYSNAMYTRNVCIILGVVLLALGVFLSNKKRALHNLAVSYLASMGVLVAVFAVLGIWAASDFNSFWTSFHHVFFSNNLWLLDPATDTMIRMLPAEVFSALVMRIVVLAAGAAVGLALLCIAYLPISKALEKKRPVVAHEDPLQLDYEDNV